MADWAGLTVLVGKLFGRAGGDVGLAPGAWLILRQADHAAQARVPVLLAFDFGGGIRYIGMLASRRFCCLCGRGAESFMAQQLPSLVIVGRPNVGKSTLFNRLTGTRRAIVTDEPGITRDRMYGKTEWNGRVLEVVDTGGIVPDDKALIPTEIFRQARVAFENAALLVLVVDSQAGITPLDQELARLLRGTGKPFVVAVNKIDSAMQEANAATFYSLGVPVFPIAAEHGTGVDDLLDEALKQALGHAVEDQPAEKKEVEIAIIGRPNVGKSTLLNRLAGEERSIVSPIPGTTMDNVDL